MVSVRQPAYSCHPFVWRRVSGGIIEPMEIYQMNRYMPLTGVDCSPAALLIDTQAPVSYTHLTLPTKRIV